MKKFNKSQIIFAFIAIALALGFGIFAFVSAIDTVRSKMSINIVDKNLDVSIMGNATYAEGHAEQIFNTETTTGGIADNTWNMPDVLLTKTTKTAEMILTLENNNEHQDINVTISGIAHETEAQYTDLAATSRYVSKVYTKYSYEDSFQYKGSATAALSEFTFLLPRLGTNDYMAIQIKIVYELLRENISFEINQNIQLTLENAIVGV